MNALLFIFIMVSLAYGEMNKISTKKKRSFGFGAFGDHSYDQNYYNDPYQSNDDYFLPNPHQHTHSHTLVTKKFGFPVPYPVKVAVPVPFHHHHPVPVRVPVTIFVPKPYAVPIFPKPQYHHHHGHFASWNGGIGGSGGHGYW